jgi:urease accessory protein UreH
VWNMYHAAVAAFLAGRPTEAQRLFTQLGVSRPEDPPGVDWLRELRTIARSFAALTDERRQVRETLSEYVRRSRTALRLPEADVCLPGASLYTV